MGGSAKADQAERFRPRRHGTGGVPNSSVETVATVTQCDSVRRRLPRRSATRRASRSLGSRHGGTREGVAQVAAVEPDVGQHAVVELGEPHRVVAILDPLGEVLEAAAGAAGKAARARAKGARRRS